MLEFQHPLFSGSTTVHRSQESLSASPSQMELLAAKITPLLRFIHLTVLMKGHTPAGLLIHLVQMRTSIPFKLVCLHKRIINMAIHLELIDIIIVDEISLIEHYSTINSSHTLGRKNVYSRNGLK